jgi:cytochrome P450
MLTLHHSADRSRTYQSRQPFWFDGDLKCFCVVDKDLIATIFRSDKFTVVAYADIYRLMSQRTSVDFTASADALDHVPLALEGANHSSMRAEFAGVLDRNIRQTMDEMERFAEEVVTSLFQNETAIDLMAQVAKPIVSRLFTLWLHVDDELTVQNRGVSQLFDREMSLARRKRLNENVSGMLCSYAEKLTMLPTSPEMAVAMNIVGKDALLGSITMSLWDTLSAHQGDRLDEISFPRRFPSTGVPFTVRVATEDLDVDGLRVQRGDLIRLYLDATAMHMSGEETDLLFGRGRHLCLGKPISLIIWRAIVRALEGIPLHFTLHETKLRSGDYAFIYPEYARVQVHD